MSTSVWPESSCSNWAWAFIAGCDENTWGQTRPPPKGQVSFWYLANDLRGVLPGAERKLGKIEALGRGLWRSQVLGRLLFLVSAVHLPIEKDSLPLPDERRELKRQLE